MHYLSAVRAGMIVLHFQNINIRHKKQATEHYREAKIIHLCGRHHFDLCHPLLLSGGVYSLDQQGQSRGWSALKSPCSINYSVVLYPKVRWIVAFKPHQTTSATADKLHCKRKQHKDFGLKLDKQREKLGL